LRKDAEGKETEEANMMAGPPERGKNQLETFPFERSKKKVKPPD